MFVGDQAGNAEEAVSLYISLFSDSELRELTHHVDGEIDNDDTVENALFTLKGVEFRATDSTLEHNFTFTPSMSIYVECDTEEEIDNAWAALSKDGAQHMPLDNYGFSKKFGWTDV